MTRQSEDFFDNHPFGQKLDRMFKGNPIKTGVVLELFARAEDRMPIEKYVRWWESVAFRVFLSNSRYLSYGVRSDHADRALAKGIADLYEVHLGRLSFPPHDVIPHPKEYLRMTEGVNKKLMPKELKESFRDHYKQRLEYPVRSSESLFPSNRDLMDKKYDEPYAVGPRYTVKVASGEDKTKADKLLFSNFINPKEYTFSDTGTYHFSEKRFAKAAMELLQSKGFKIDSAVTEGKSPGSISERIAFRDTPALTDDEVMAWMYEYLHQQFPGDTIDYSNDRDLIKSMNQFIRRNTRKRFSLDQITGNLKTVLKIFRDEGLY